MDSSLFLLTHPSCDPCQRLKKGGIGNHVKEISVMDDAGADLVLEAQESGIEVEGVPAVFERDVEGKLKACQITWDGDNVTAKCPSGEKNLRSHV